MRQVILSTFCEPLFLELYFRNYSKFKQCVDRLVICFNTPIRPGENTEEEYRVGRETLDKVISKYNIPNVIIKEFKISTYFHGELINYLKEFILEDGYDTYFDDIDAYFLNDNFDSMFKSLDEYDLIGGGLSRLFTQDQVMQFNKTYGLKHSEMFITCMPKFIKHGVLKGLTLDFVGHGHPFDKEEIITGINKSHLNRDLVGADTFWNVDIEVFKKTDKIKIIDIRSWYIPISLICDTDVDLDNTILLHLTNAHHFYYLRLWKDVPYKPQFEIFSDRLLIHVFYVLYDSLERIDNPCFSIDNYRKSLVNFVIEEERKLHPTEHLLNRIL